VLTFIDILLTALDPGTSTLVAFSTWPLMSTIADICTQRVKPVPNYTAL